MRDATAYHEAGHVVARFAFALPVSSASIAPDGDSLGHVRHRKRDGERLWRKLVELHDGGAPQALGYRFAQILGPVEKRKQGTSLALVGGSERTIGSLEYAEHADPGTHTARPNLGSSRHRLTDCFTRARQRRLSKRITGSAS